MASITEVADDIYRVNIELSGSPLSFSFFVIKDDQPALVETGFAHTFEESLAAVKRLIDPARLRYIVIPHFEGDESGALNHFLSQAPHAQAVGSAVGALTNLADSAVRPPLAVDEEQALDLGQHRVRFLITPHVHTWDSMLAWDETTGTVFASDVFITPGTEPAITDRDRTEEMLTTYRRIGLFPSQAHLNAALDKIEALNPRVLACHHGSVIDGKIETYIRTLRENDVTGVTAWNPMQGVSARLAIWGSPSSSTGLPNPSS